MYKIFTLSILILAVSLLSGCAGARDQLKQSRLEEASPISEEIFNNFEYRLGDFDVLEVRVWEGVGKTRRRKDKEALEEEEYLISKGDKINIYVWQWDDLNREVIVRPDGRLSFPLVGDIIVEGLTLTELDEIVTERLKEYIKYPEVSVMVSAFGQGGFGTKMILGDLPAEIMVRPDGRISFPFLGEIMVRGLTLRELDLELTQSLAEVIYSPEVYINLSAIGGKRVIVLGEVATPGVYKPKDNARLLDVIAMAGGTTADAALNSILLVRGGLKNSKAFRINLSRIMKKGDLRKNIYIQAEDIVYVPKTFISDVSYVLEQLLGPLQSSEKAVTAITTIKPGVTP